MLAVNEYYDGNVKSISFQNEEGTATVGVLEPGIYEFSTSTIEYMTIISGSVSAKLPDTNEWKVVRKGETFTVHANQKFKMEVAEQTAYSCFYI